jgi:uncharacterized membrane-anchored protein
MDAKKWYKSKIVQTNAIVLVGSIAVFYGISENQFAELMALATALVGAINIGLRFITKKPVEL